MGWPLVKRFVPVTLNRMIFGQAPLFAARTLRFAPTPPPNSHTRLNPSLTRPLPVPAGSALLKRSPCPMRLYRNPPFVPAASNGVHHVCLSAAVIVAEVSLAGVLRSI